MLVFVCCIWRFVFCVSSLFWETTIITEQEIMDNAPSGATHTVTEFGLIDYIKHECGNWYVWRNKDWVRLHPIVVNGYRNKMKPI